MSAAVGTMAEVGEGGAANIFLNTFGFNQDQSCFVAGTTSGFRVYTTSPVSEVHRRESTASGFDPRSVVLISMLFKTQIFVMASVADGEGNKLKIYDDCKHKFIGELRSRYAVKGVAMRRDIIVMVCEYAIYVYTCDKLRVILHLTTNANSNGLCVVAADSQPWILCCPGQGAEKGLVRVQVGQDISQSHVFKAHENNLAAMALNSSGTLVATASENGHLVKVFQTKDGQELYRLRRGTSQTTISSIAFRCDDRFLAVASSSPTVHIFSLDPENSCAEGDVDGANLSVSSPVLGPADPPISTVELEDPRSPLEQITSQLQQVMTRVTSQNTTELVSDMTKAVMPRYFKDIRSFARFVIPDVDQSGQATVDARSKQDGAARIHGPQLAFHRTEPKLSVLHYSGVLYECSFDPDRDPSMGTQDCGLVNATTWFAVRPEFKVQGPSTQVQTVAGGASEEDEEAEEWQLL